MVQIENLGRIIEEHPFFKGLPAELLELLSGCAANERYEAEQYVFREGTEANKFYLVRHGSVAVEMHVPGRPPLVIETIQDDEILGWSWLVPPYRWSFDARATRLTRVISLDAACLRRKMEADPRLGYDVLKRFVPIMGHRVAAARMQMLDLYASPSDRR
jgi:CRP/FNR family cyclic AMP-dependent transcriptional regulator